MVTARDSKQYLTSHLLPTLGRASRAEPPLLFSLEQLQAAFSWESSPGSWCRRRSLQPWPLGFLAPWFLVQTPVPHWRTLAFWCGLRGHSCVFQACGWTHAGCCHGIQVLHCIPEVSGVQTDLLYSSIFDFLGEYYNPMDCVSVVSLFPCKSWLTLMKS